MRRFTVMPLIPIFTDTDGQEFTMIDTAGMRKSGKVYENTEKYSVMRATCELLTALMWS